MALHDVLIDFHKYIHAGNGLPVGNSVFFNIRHLVSAFGLQERFPSAFALPLAVQLLAHRLHHHTAVSAGCELFHKYIHAGIALSV